MSSAIALAPAWVRAQEPVPIQRPTAPTPAPPAETSPPPLELAPTEAPPAEAPPAEAPPAEAPSAEAPPAEAPPGETPPAEAPSEPATTAIDPAAALGVAPVPPPEPVDDAEESEDDDDPSTYQEIPEDKLERSIRRSQSMIAAGSIAALGGFVMVIAAAVEASKPDCKFGEDDCNNAPRPAVAKGMGIGGAVLLAGGGALLGWGIFRLRRVRAQLRGDRNSAGIVLTGRF